MIMLVPKIIHQTIRDKSDLDPRIRANIERLKSLNGDWDYRLYDDRDIRDFIASAYGADYLRTFDKIRPAYGAAKADFFRYLVIYHSGGVYLDIKSTAERPLSTVIGETDSLLLSHWNSGDAAEGGQFGRWPELGVPDEFQQWHIIAQPGHPYLKEVVRRVKANIDHYDPRKLGVGTVGTLRTTGPIAYSLAIETMVHTQNHRLVDAGELGLRYSIFEAFGNEHRGLIGSTYAGAQLPVAKLSLVKSALFLLHRAKRKFGHLLNRNRPAGTPQSA
jgi:hypothetical protein